MARSRNCQTLVVANKRYNDAVYFSRIDVDQLGMFFERLAILVAFVWLTIIVRLDHMLYDVGIDYRVEVARCGSEERLLRGLLTQCQAWSTTTTSP
jgi:hypothetical protein